MPTLDRYLITFCIGAAATLAWQSYGDAALETVAKSYPQLSFVAPRPTTPIANNVPDVIATAGQAAPSPDGQQLNDMSLDLAAIRQSVEQIASSQERVARGVDQLTAGQGQVTREITKLQAVEQHKNSELPPRPARAVARKQHNADRAASGH
jgi:hypothetical protein